MRKNKHEAVSDKIVRFIGSRTFFLLIIVFFILQSGWLAASASYPMLYDEYYHPGVIDMYSNQWSPLITTQTPDQTAIYGDQTRNSSYLFHYLLSFPYKIITSISDSFYTGIVSLRLINVSFVAVGLILYRRLFMILRFSQPVIHSALLALTVLPIFPHVAAHVNYDNLIFLLTPAFLLYGIKLLQSEGVSYKYVGIFISIGAAASIVKYAFLPIFATASLYILTVLIYRHRAKLFRLILDSFKKEKHFAKWAVLVLVIFSVGLFSERILGNIIMYGGVQPKCQVVQPLEDCSKQPIVQRSLAAREEQRQNPVKLDNLIEYTRTKWLPAMISGSSFVYANVGSQEKYGMTVIANERGAPLPVVYSFLWLCLFAAVVFLAYSWRELRKIPNFWFFVSVFLIYLFVLLVMTNYLGYRKNGQAFAMQPRYLLLLLPVVFVFTAQAINVALSRRINKLAILAVFLLLFTQGGGISTYVIRSNESWYWQRETIIDANMKLKKIIAPAINEQ